MPVGGSTWAHGPEDEAAETELPQGVQFSISEMPVRYTPPVPTEAQQKHRRQVPRPTREGGE
jgi:hypothetical protein